MSNFWALMIAFAGCIVLVWLAVRALDWWDRKNALREFDAFIESQNRWRESREQERERQRLQREYMDRMLAFRTPPPSEPPNYKAPYTGPISDARRKRTEAHVAAQREFKGRPHTKVSLDDFEATVRDQPIRWPATPDVHAEWEETRARLAPWLGEGQQLVAELEADDQWWSTIKRPGPFVFKGNTFTDLWTDDWRAPFPEEVDAEPTPIYDQLVAEQAPILFPNWDPVQVRALGEAARSRTYTVPVAGHWEPVSYYSDGVFR